MGTPATSPSPATFRWLLAVVLLFTAALFATSLVRAPEPSTRTIETLSLIGVAGVVSAWRWYPPMASLFTSLAMLLMIAWAWRVQPRAALGWDLGALIVLGAAAAAQQQWHARQVWRWRQRLEQTQGVRQLKEQAAALSHQASEALSKKLHRYAQLQSIAEALSKTTTLESVAQLAVEHAMRLIGKSDVCLLLLVDAQQQALSLVASKKREATISVHAKHGDPFDRYVLKSHHPLLVTDVRRDFRFTPLKQDAPPAAEKSKTLPTNRPPALPRWSRRGPGLIASNAAERSVQSVIACPLLLDQRPEGVLRLDSSRAGAYTQDDLRLLDVLADLVATAVMNAKLFAQVQRLAVTDGLTGLSLRRAFLEQLTYELTRASRSGGVVSVLMLDVDHFKRYNDTLGHLAGDALLKSVGRVLRRVVPTGGIIARYGGDEFGVLLPRVGREQARAMAETIRQLVQQQGQDRGRALAAGASDSVATGHAVDIAPEMRATPTPPESSGHGHARASAEMTVSIGVASFPDDAQIEMELIRIADRRLYQAKHAGRNRVVSP